MKYENAKDILPAKLLEEVQKYAEGKVIYIPRSEKVRGWGEASGYREKLKKRNAQICSRYSAGESIMEIAEEFFLSPETIKKLVYGKKVELPMFSPSIASAEQYAAAGMGEEWVRNYLSAFGEEVPDTSDFFMSELVRIPLRLIEIDTVDLNRENAVADAGSPHGSMPSIVGSMTANSGKLGAYDVPLIVLYDQRTFSVPFQPGYLEALKKAKQNAHYAFVFAKNEDYGFFWNNYGKNFRR